jgi:predicted nucleic acid-binding protein
VKKELFEARRKKKIAASKRLLTRDEIYVLAFTCFEISAGASKGDE